MERDKAGLSSQMTHDTALHPGLLFMASHVSKGSLPWGAAWLLPTKPGQALILGLGGEKTVLSAVGTLMAVMRTYKHMAERLVD